MSMTKNQEEKVEQRFQQIEQAIPDKRNPITYPELERAIEKWLLIEDKGFIRVIVGTVIANKLMADPVWLFIVAAPGGTKTELIRGLSKIEGIYPISDLTPQTLLSGERGQKNASLLLRIPYGTIFTYKDFTTVLTMHRDKQQAIISQLREIFDGSYRKEFGTGETKDWQGKIGFIAGVTAAIDRHYEIYSVLGERFIQYRPVQPDPVALAKKAMANSGGEKAMREEIQNAFADFIVSIKIPEKGVEVSEEIKNRVAHLAALCVRARSGIIRDGYSTREIELIPDAELPTRLAKQLTTLMAAFALVYDAPEENYELIYKIGMDSIPKKRKRALEALVASGEQLETADVALAIEYPTNTTRRILEELHGLGLAKRQHEGKGYADKWEASDDTKKFLAIAKPERIRNENKPKPAQEPNQTDASPEMSDDITQEINNLFDAPGSDTLPEKSGE